METAETQKYQKVSDEILNCSLCNYNTCIKSNFAKHLSTNKHIRKQNGNEKVSKSIVLFNCINCNKIYTSRSGVWKHSKSCDIHCIDKNENIIIQKDNEVDYKELLIACLKDNSDLKCIIKEMIPKMGNNIHHNTNNITNKVSIKVFLNEQCKDAITMDCFLDSIKISLQDLLYTRSKGLANGLSNILIENLNKLPLTQRPIHCTDLKRETIYIKNETWEKDENQTKTKAAIKKASGIQIKNIHKFKEAKPNCMQISRQKDEYMEVIKATTDDVTEIENKIIKNVCKIIYVNDKLME
ncbi:MAG: hypothetical protein WD512_17160 [Candidatus Paceibacterota bacterium]